MNRLLYLRHHHSHDGSFGLTDIIGLSIIFIIIIFGIIFIKKLDNE